MFKYIQTVKQIHFKICHICKTNPLYMYLTHSKRLFKSVMYYNKIIPSYIIKNISRVSYPDV